MIGHRSSDRRGGAVLWRMIGREEGGIDTAKGKRKICCKKERKSFSKVVVPSVAAVEDGKRLGDVEVEKAKGG